MEKDQPVYNSDCFSVKSFHTHINIVNLIEQTNKYVSLNKHLCACVENEIAV